jgi:hypothetical protein
MNRLSKLGFEYAGEWSIQNKILKIDLNHMKERKNVLYSFVVSGQVKYIGKTLQKLSQRMVGYKTPGKSQSTNIKNNNYIHNHFIKDEIVEIHVMPDDGKLSYGGYQLNLAAGLEDALILAIDPPWNGKQRKNESKNIVVDEWSEKENQFLANVGKNHMEAGHFNVPVSHSMLFGEHDEEITIHIDKYPSIKGKINRNAQSKTRSPRIYGYKGLREWYKKHNLLYKQIIVTVLNKNEISIDTLK